MQKRHVGGRNKGRLRPGDIAKLPIVIGVVFALAGSVLLFQAQAATWVASQQAESGQLNGTVTVEDSTASGGKAVKFVAKPKRFTSTAAATALASATTISEAETALKSFLSQYNMQPEITSVPRSPTNGDNFSYKLLTSADLPALKIYGTLLIDEWAKYPKSWTTWSQIKSIAFVKEFAYIGQQRAAAYDAQNTTNPRMIYDVRFSGLYARQVIHHEYDHLTAFRTAGGTGKPDPTWTSYNPAGFQYGSGGASCNLDPDTCQWGDHVIIGFMTGYAATSLSEDKAETMGYMMTTEKWKLVKEWVKTDSTLKKKVDYYKAYTSSHASEMGGSYFDDINP